MPNMPNLPWQIGGSMSYATYIYAKTRLCERCHEDILDTPGAHLHDPEDSAVQTGVIYGSIRFRDRGPDVDLIDGAECTICGVDLDGVGWDVRFIAQLKPAITI